jgi:hypothetical protein
MVDGCLWVGKLQSRLLAHLFLKCGDVSEKHVRLTGQMLTAVAQSMPADAPQVTRQRIREALENIERTTSLMSLRLNPR